MASTTAVTSTTTATSSTTDATDASGSTTASPVEVCDGIDNDGDGLVDEFSESNAQCNSCTLFEVDHHAYWICSEPVDWFTHLLRCEAKGAVPIRIDDYATNGTIASYLEFEALSFIWIGANDMEVEGTWVWSDGAPVTFTLWNTDLGQPNNEAPGQHCAVLRDNAYWHDEDCLILRGFGCMTAEP